jgi:ankyrin repeat protein
VAEVLLTKTSLPIDHQGRTGNTALMFAAQWGQTASVEYLLKASADVTLTNANGDTALSLAMKNGHRDIAVLLRAYGAV